MQSAFCCKTIILKATTSSYAANKSIAFILAQVVDDLCVSNEIKNASQYSLTGMTSKDGFLLYSCSAASALSCQYLAFASSASTPSAFS
jgi:hypothetical protein